MKKVYLIVLGVVFSFAISACTPQNIEDNSPEATDCCGDDTVDPPPPPPPPPSPGDEG